MEARSPTLQVDSLPAESQGKPKDTGVGSLFLLQWIFPTQKSNQGLLHCRQILYQLRYQGGPFQRVSIFYFVAAVTVCTDFGAQENETLYCFHIFPICYEVMGPDAMILVFFNIEF